MFSTAGAAAANPGCLTLLEIFWFSLRVCVFVVNISYQFLYFTVSQYKISRGKPRSIDIEVSNLGKCQLTHLLIGR